VDPDLDPGPDPPDPHALGLLDPDLDLLVGGVDPDPDLAPEPSIIMQNSKKSLDTYYL
jgi:hypothetical protein